MTHDEDYSGSSVETEEGLRFLLGGLTSSDFTHDAWDNQSLPEQDSVSDTNVLHEHRQREEENLQKIFHHGFFASKSFPCHDAFLNSHKSTPYGNLRPPVRIVDLSSEGRGNILVATERIERGQVIFTERAAVATCQFCFRSLEPIQSCCVSKTEQLPSPHLWPISNLDFSSGEAEGNIEIDRFGRRHCNLCQSHFCSPSCHNSFQSHIGDCCKLTAIQREIRNYIHSSRNDEEVEMIEDVEPALMLATRLFVINVHHYRAASKLWMEDSILTMCGDAEDLIALELGQPVVSSADGRLTYNLQRLYDALVERFSISAVEQSTLSSELLGRFASIAARNGFGVRTQSPFRSYYAALLRSIGGRDNSAKHLEVQNHVARALGASSLQRGMDRQLDAKVAPEIVALFLLISRINHSCCPNAEVLSQEFVDNHVDLVAKETIESGEEITISYIGTGPQSATGRLGRHKRQRELYASPFRFYAVAQPA